MHHDLRRNSGKVVEEFIKVKEDFISFEEELIAA